MLPVKRGDRGQWVRYLQDLLNRSGAHLRVDGIFGPLTEAALRAFQQRAGLLVDGIAGQATWARLKGMPLVGGRDCGAAPPVRVMHIPADRPNRPGRPLEAEWVTVHNTANPTSTAVGEATYAARRADASFHYVVDEREVVEVVPPDEVAYHAGSVANGCSIGVEICESGDPEKTWRNAVAFVADLLRQRGWGVDRVTTHQRWTGKNCPRLLLPRWNEFVADVARTLGAAASGTPIRGKAELSPELLRAALAARNPSVVLEAGGIDPYYAGVDLVGIYYKLGDIYEQPADLAFLQAAKETNWWRFGGFVQPWQYNPCGLGATGAPASGDEDLRGAAPWAVRFVRGVHGAVFASPWLGAEAHMQHLFAYRCTDPLPEGRPLVDPRFGLVQRGVAPCWEDLDGRWAVPGVGYGASIVAMRTVIARG